MQVLAYAIWVVLPIYSWTLDNGNRVFDNQHIGVIVLVSDVYQYVSPIGC
jgi:hypothetical protein